LQWLKKWHFRVNARHISPFGKTTKLVLIYITGFEKNTQDFEFYGLLFALLAQRVLKVRYFSLFIWTMFRLVFCFSVFWPSDCFQDFLVAFFRPKKSFKQPSGLKSLAAAKKSFFVLPHDSYVVAFLPKIYHE